MDLRSYTNYRNNKIVDPFWLGMDPNWRCPYCDDGVLSIDQSMFFHQETDRSIKQRHEACWESEWTEYNFMGTLTCKSCKDMTFFSGSGTVLSFQNPETGECELEERFTPHYFQPAIPLFDIPVECPSSVRDVIQESFSMAWSSYSGAGSLVRVAVEKLMSEIAPHLKGTLGEKINSFAEIDHSTGELLKAIKWIGNSGSHQADLEEHDLATAYKIMELVIKNTLCAKSDEIADVAKIINEAKGPVR